MDPPVSVPMANGTTPAATAAAEPDEDPPTSKRLSFGLTGYLVARLGTYPMIQAAAWLPWLAWAAHGWLTGESRRAGPLLAAFVALQLLAGHAQTAWYSLLLVALYCGIPAACWSVVSTAYEKPAYMNARWAREINS